MRKMLGIATGLIAMAAAGGAGVAGASTHPALSGTEHFQLVSTSTTSNREVVIAYGAFTARAVDVQRAHRGEVRRQVRAEQAAGRR